MSPLKTKPKNDFSIDQEIRSNSILSIKSLADS